MAHSLFETKLQTHAARVDQFIRSYFASMNLQGASAVINLIESMSYSANTGGKRFRPVLSLLVADLFGCDVEKILPFATAVEFVHTYSLIHDDLPCMDDDDVRRGLPANHVKFGETTALLAGDALLTEAFLVISDGYQNDGALAGKLCSMLSRAAGIHGMVGGQAIDLNAKNLNLEELVCMHNLKTGRMIQVAAEGAAVISGAKTEELQAVAEYGKALGLAFQVADDILDQNDKDQESRSFVSVIGLEGTQRYLAEVSAQALNSLRKIRNRSELLEQMIVYNQNRNK